MAQYRQYLRTSGPNVVNICMLRSKGMVEDILEITAESSSLSGAHLPYRPLIIA